MQKLLLAALASALAFSSAAQTGRIAHFSHGGSAAVLTTSAKADNFGVVPTIFEPDSARLLSKHKVIFYGRWIGSYPTPEQRKATTAIETIGAQGHWPSVESIIEAYKDYYRPFKFINFDSTKASYQGNRPRRSNKALKPVPEKPSGQIQTFPKRPFQYSYWRGLAGVVGLGAVGWLLGKKANI